MYNVRHDIIIFFPWYTCICLETVVDWHIWWVTRVQFTSSLGFGYSGCAHTLRFNMPHTCLLGVKSILCAGHWNVRRLFVVLLAAWRGVLYFGKIISRLKRICCKRTDRMTSFGCHIAFMFPLCTWKRLCALLYAHYFSYYFLSYKPFHKEYFPTKQWQLHCRAREARAHSHFRTYCSARMVLYIDKCIISVNR